NFTGDELSLVIRRNEQRLVFSVQPEMVVDEVIKNSAAEAAQVRVGDRITSINGKDPSRYKDALLRGTFPADEKKLDLHIIRDGSRSIMSMPLPASGDSGLRVSGKIGIVPAENLTFQRYGPLSAIKEGFKQAWEMTTLTVWALGKLLSLDVSFKTLGGPIMIAKMTGTAAKSGLASLIIFTAFLSMNLSILNLLPVPILDGGHLLFFLIEFIIRRPLGTKSMEMAQKVGLVLLILLLITVTYNDILRALPQKYIDFLPWK
ncbi:MAG: rseP, partial [Deltaproteobacteria bacterium]|nr:rseP [Deltaproteobacteria bacterium]